MNKITTIGLDVAKKAFHVVCCDRYGRVVSRKMLKRSQVLNARCTRQQSERNGFVK